MVLLLAGCGDYVPPLKSPADQAALDRDLAACQDEGHARADADVKKRGHTFFTYPVSFPLAERRLITDCMVRHGYVRDD